MWKAENVSDGSRVFNDNEFHVDCAEIAKLRGPYVLIFARETTKSPRSEMTTAVKIPNLGCTSFRDTTVHFDVGT